MKSIEFQSEIRKVETMVDRTVKVTLCTQELPSGLMAELFTLKDSHCSVTIEPHGMAVEGKVVSNTGAPKGKSKSERLRGALYVLWRSSDGGFADFEQFYNVRMEGVIEAVKSEINGQQ